MLPIQSKQIVVENMNCVLTKGSGYIDFDILHWQTGKPVGQFHYGQLNMD